MGGGDTSPKKQEKNMTGNNKSEARIRLEIEHYNAMTAYYASRTLFLQAEENIRMYKKLEQINNK